VPVLPGGARDRGALLSDPLPLVFASVGTDYHPFDRLSRWIDAWLEGGGAGSARCFVQTGTSAVPRRKRYGEHVDDHQCAFSERIAAEGAIVLAQSEEELGSSLDAALGRDASATLPPNGAGPARAVAMFEQLVDDLVLHASGSRKGKGVVRSAPVSRRRA
jgi:UDP-N-acetylglucosamine transferase subunit ALG13